MLCYVVFGGMLATTWVQIIKAVPADVGDAGADRCSSSTAIGWNPIELFNRAADEHPQGDAFLAPGLQLRQPDRHDLARPRPRAGHGGPAAHPDALLHRAGRQGRALVRRLGDVPDRRLLPDDHGAGLRRARDPGRGGRRRRPARAATWPRRSSPRSWAAAPARSGGDLFLAIIAAVAFATILAVVAGLVITASGAVAHDVWSNIVRKGQDNEHEEVLVARIAAFAIGAIAIVDRPPRRRRA